MSDYRIDSRKFLPRSMWAAFDAFPDQGPCEPAQASGALRNAKVALLTSGGLYMKKSQRPFDIEREKRDPYWGDPSYRIIPRDVGRGEVGVAHLHLNPDDIESDFNVALPLEIFAELERLGEIGRLAERNYSFMGYQGRSCDPWRETYGPELASSLHADAVSVLILAPT
jgi:hypothetical protein